jgi:starvation-inducible DNA-binding protein
MTTADTAAGRALHYTVPGMPPDDAVNLADMLQERLDNLTELALTLKHVHWNVVGPHFIAVHTMIDPQVDAVRDMADAIAERITTLGASPHGLPGGMVSRRSNDDYLLGRREAIEHLRALSLTYTRVIIGQREAIAAATDDLVTQDMLISQSAALEKFPWFVRAHSETFDGQLGW